MTNAWVAFVQARLADDEDEAIATADADAEFWADVSGDGTHFARHDPARVLRQVAALRGVLAEILRYEETADGEWGDGHTAAQIAAGECEDTSGAGELNGVRALAAIWSDHPDYPGEHQTPHSVV